MSEQDVEELKPIEAGGIDFSELEGSKPKIATTAVETVKSDYTEDGEYQKGLQRDVQVLRVVTEPVTKITTKDGEKEIGASEIFNLKKDAEGNIGWSKSPKGKLNKLLNKLGAKHPSELVGKKVTVRVRVKETVCRTARRLCMWQSALEPGWD